VVTGLRLQDTSFKIQVSVYRLQVTSNQQPATNKIMNKRRGISVFGIVLIALIIGEFLKNVRIGLIIGLALGLLASGMLKKREK